MENNAVVKKPRLEWLDALRGFTMILVVANHVAGMGFGEEWKHSSAIPFLILFRMPLFFFVSGFLAYKASQVWDLKNFGMLLWKKVKVQTIPTVVFFFLAMAILNRHFWPAVEDAFHSPLKGGYWFTIALLYMFIIYYVFSYLESKLKWKSWIPVTLLFLISIGFYETNYLPKYFSWAQGYKGVKTDLFFFLQDSSFVQVFLYFPFFLYGNIVHRYWDKWQRVIDSKWFFPIVIIIVILATLDALKWRTLRMTWAIIPLTVSRFGLLTITFMYFRHYQKYFTKFTFMGVSLQYIGRRTLDIYLIHFLFMPDLPQIGEFFKSYPHNFVLDIVLSTVLGLVIIGFSIITSNILRISPFFKKWLFGRS
ncbi:MAG: acyltransferase [Prevotella sp.]|nr:acyltransferase [Prevotella sp.]